MSTMRHTLEDQPAKVRRIRPSSGSRRLGYAVAIAVNGLLLQLINVRPGWEALPFLTSGMTQVLPFVNASLVGAVVANAIWVVYDPAWLRAFGDAVTTGLGIAAMIRLWQVFPFQFTDSSVPWEMVTRWLIGFGLVGALIGLLVALGRLGVTVIRNRRC